VTLMIRIFAALICIAIVLGGVVVIGLIIRMIYDMVTFERKSISYVVCVEPEHYLKVGRVYKVIDSRLNKKINWYDVYDDYPIDNEEGVRETHPHRRHHFRPATKLEVLIKYKEDI